VSGEVIGVVEQGLLVCEGASEIEASVCLHRLSPG
jgi:hypothetical protein